MVGVVYKFTNIINGMMVKSISIKFYKFIAKYLDLYSIKAENGCWHISTYDGSYGYGTRYESLDIAIDKFKRLLYG